MLDNLDCKIIKILQEDGSISKEKIARMLGVSAGTIGTRVKRLLEENYIKIVAISTPKKLGYLISGTIKIKIDMRKKDYVLEKLKNIDQVIKINRLTGDMDVKIFFIVRSLPELNQLVHEKIANINGITTTETSIVLETAKQSYNWGTAFDDQ